MKNYTHAHARRGQACVMLGEHLAGVWQACGSFFHASKPLLTTLGQDLHIITFSNEDYHAPQYHNNPFKVQLWFLSSLLPCQLKNIMRNYLDHKIHTPVP